MYSDNQRCQKWRTSAWHRCQWRRRVKERLENEGSGRASNNLPMRKCPGVRAPIPSLSGGRETRGLLLRPDSTWARTVVNSTNVTFTLPTIHLKCVFMLFTAASQRPPKWGVCSGMNFCCIFCVEQNSEIASCDLFFFRNTISSLISWAAPTKFVLWSLHIRVGFPRREMKRLRQAKKASVVKSDTTSKCTAFTESETRTLA